MLGQRPCAIVTGASRGIGAAIAVRLAKDGFNIGFCYRSNADGAARTAEAVTAAGAEVVQVGADVANRDEVGDFVEKVVSNLGPVNTVVNCAGINRDRTLLLMGQDDWSQVLDVNLTGAYNVCRATAGGLVRQRGGSIVNVSSVIGVIGGAGQINYAASKAGSLGLTMALAKELGRFSVRVNAVAPGYIHTDMLAAVPEKMRQRFVPSVALGRFGEPEEVAHAVSFLVSDHASYISGAILRVDGGYDIRN